MARAILDDHVFINCPFDDQYQPLFNAIVFTVHDAGFVARCAREVGDAAQNRMEKILSIVGECRYGIHDISRTELNAKRLPRFNMPLELGAFLGCKRFGGKRHSSKTALILDREAYRYQQFISDIAGQDIDAHGSDPERAVQAVRQWLRTESRRNNVPGGAVIWQRFQEFQVALPTILANLHVGLAEMAFVDYTYAITEWLRANPL